MAPNLKCAFAKGLLDHFAHPNCLFWHLSFFIPKFWNPWIVRNNSQSFHQPSSLPAPVQGQGGEAETCSYEGCFCVWIEAFGKEVGNRRIWWNFHKSQYSSLEGKMFHPFTVVLTVLEDLDIYYIQYVLWKMEVVKTTLLKVIFQGSHLTEIDRMVEVKGSVGARVDVRPLGAMIYLRTQQTRRCLQLCHGWNGLGWARALVQTGWFCKSHDASFDIQRYSLQWQNEKHYIFLL